MGRSYLKYLRLFSCNFPNSEYKGLSWRGNCTKYKLFNDIEKNAGAVSKTIKLHIVKGMLLYLDKMQGSNVLQWLYVL